MSTIGLNLTDIYEHVHQQHDVEQHMQLELLRKPTQTKLDIMKLNIMMLADLPTNLALHREKQGTVLLA